MHVVDLIVTGNNTTAFQEFKQHLSHCFHTKDLWSLKYFLGIEVARNNKGIYLSQWKYALDILSNAGLLRIKPCGFPIKQNH